MTYPVHATMPRDHHSVVEVGLQLAFAVLVKVLRHRSFRCRWYRVFGRKVPEEAHVSSATYRGLAVCFARYVARPCANP